MFNSVSREYIARLESGKHDPPLSRIEKIAAALRVTTMYAPKLTPQGHAKNDGRPGIKAVDRLDEARRTRPLGQMLSALWAAQAKGHREVQNCKPKEGTQQHHHTRTTLTSQDTCDG